MINKVAILGCGNVAKALAADMSLKGVEVRLYNSPSFLPEGFARLMERKEIILTDMRKELEGVTSTVKIYKVTTEIKDAVKNADYIIVALPAVAHSHYFKLLIPHLEDGQTVYICPGNFGSLLLAHMMKQEGVVKDIIIAESDTVPTPSRPTRSIEVALRKTSGNPDADPSLMRDTDPLEITINCDCIKFLVATLPSKNVEKVLSELRQLYPAGVRADNVLSTSMSNPNTPVHPTGAILNTGLVETLKDKFVLYQHGITYSVAKIIRAVYDEIESVAKAMDVSILQYPEHTFWEKSTIMVAYYKAPFDSENIVAAASGPNSMKHRYISEDVPFGQVPIALLGHQYKVATPIIDSIINLASAMNRSDYWKEGRSLEELGIAGLDRNKVHKILNNGF